MYKSAKFKAKRAPKGQSLGTIQRKHTPHKAVQCFFFPFPSHSSSIFIEPFVRLGIFTLNDNELGLSVSFTCARAHSTRWNWEKMDNLQIMSRSLSLNLSAKEPETFQLLLRSWNEMMKCIRVNLYFGLPLFYDIRKWKFVIFWCPRDLSCDLFMSSEHSPLCWSKEQKKKNNTTNFTKWILYQNVAHSEANSSIPIANSR